MLFFCIIDSLKISFKTGIFCLLKRLRRISTSSTFPIQCYILIISINLSSSNLILNTFARGSFELMLLSSGSITLTVSKFCSWCSNSCQSLVMMLSELWIWKLWAFMCLEMDCWFITLWNAVFQAENVSTFQNGFFLGVNND